MTDRRVAFALPLGAFLVTVLVFLPFARIGVDPHHDGIMLKPALDVLSGQRLYTDTFSQYGSLSTYLQVIFLAVFGKTLYAIKLGTVLMYAAASAFLTAAWRRFLPTSLVVLAYLLWLTLAPFYERGWVLLPWSSVYALAFQASALYFLLRAAESDRPGLLALACGVCAALVFWCRFPVGVLLAGALVVSYVALAMTRRSRAWHLSFLIGAIGGGLAVHLGFLAFLVLSGTLEDWFIQTLKWPMTWISMPTTDLTTVLPGKGGKIVSGLFALRYFYALTLSYSRAYVGVGLLHLLLGALAVALAISVFLGVERVLLGHPAHRFRALLRERFPLLLVLSGLAIFLWFGSPTDVGPGQDVFPWRLSRVYPWEVMVPMFLLATTVVVFRRWPSFVKRQGNDDAARINATLCAVVALASWPQYYPIADCNHMFWGVSPALGAFVYFLYLIGRAKAGLVALGIALLALPLVNERVEAARVKLALDYQELRGSSVLRGMRVPPVDAARWEAVIRAIDSATAGRDNVPIMIEGDDAIYATFVKDLHNCSPFYIGWAGLPRRDDHVERSLRFVAERQPLIYVQAKNAARAPSIAELLHYVVLERIDGSGDVLLGPAPGALPSNEKRSP
jgi:hypothetical protein